jgi:predicted DNA-binding transcriptional regulator YafY
MLLARSANARTVRKSCGNTATAVGTYRLVSWGRKWYLVAWDIDRDDWRTFRVDRLELRLWSAPGSRRGNYPRAGTSRPTWRGVSSAGVRFPARVTVHAPADVVAARINPAVGVVEPVDEHSCVLATGADSVATVAVYLGLLDLDFEVRQAPELVAKLTDLADRYRRATRTDP